MPTRCIVVTYYRDSDDQWRWRARSSNGKILGDSGEGYLRIGACKRGFRALVRAANSDAIDEVIEAHVPG